MERDKDYSYVLDIFLFNVTVNMMTFSVTISQQYYNFTDSRSEKAGVKELRTKHIPYATV